MLESSVTTAELYVDEAGAALEVSCHCLRGARGERQDHIVVFFPGCTRSQRAGGHCLNRLQGLS